jgi:isopentenyl-diphosphate Delta-isomerase
MNADAQVSFDSDELILVDSNDRELGHASKASCHDGEGVLHRAFSVFVFNDAGEVLLQRRSAEKRLWPRFWANSCCSHPRRGEALIDAARRRVHEELSLSVSLVPLYHFEYHARFGAAGSEHELCHVLVGSSSAPVRVNRREIEEVRHVGAAELDREIHGFPERFTPWLKLEWRRLRDEHSAELHRFNVR